MGNNTEFGLIEGNLQIRTINEDDQIKIMIYGDPEGMESFGNVLINLARTDQNKYKNMPDGERDHTHIYPGHQLSLDSSETIIGRLDAKGTGAFPEGYKSNKN